MGNLMGELVGPGEETPLGKAQEVLDLAFEEDDRKRRADLARQALAISPDCGDAYILLAEQAESRKGALALYEQAVAAGERAVGPEAFAGDVGQFWGPMETRPSMRAMRPPLAWELELMEGCLRAIPDFVARHRPGDTGEARMKVPVATRAWDLRLSWAGEG